MAEEGVVVRLKAMHYAHIHDQNSNNTRLVTGPNTSTLSIHEKLVVPPTPFIEIPPMHYCVIENPVVLEADGKTAVIDKTTKGAKVLNGELQVRYNYGTNVIEPFALYPEEKLKQGATKLQVITNQEALSLKVLRPYTTQEGAVRINREAGEEWLLMGPAVYIPRVEEEVKEIVKAKEVGPNEALLLRAVDGFTDRNGVARKAGEEYLYEKPGAYIVDVHEKLEKRIRATILAWNEGLHVEVKNAFRDERPWANKDRKAGERYLVTQQLTEAFIPHPCERILENTKLISLTHREFAVVLDPWDSNDAPRLGAKEVRTNTSFFLKPGEKLADGIQQAYVLTEDQTLLISATETFQDNEGGKAVNRNPGDRWLIRGPGQYVPSATVQVHGLRNAIPLSSREGIYVKNRLTGEVRLQTDGTYMLQAEEDLWDKELDPITESLWQRQGQAHTEWMVTKVDGAARRIKHRAVTFALPANTVAQVYDFKSKQKKIEFGPKLVMLGPEEEFTLLSLSGSDWDMSQPDVVLPKKADKIKTVYLFLGPESMSDVLEVETMDHARLRLQLSYQWFFDIKDRANPKVFEVRDFVGDCCACIASRIRGRVASVTFDDFHKRATDIVEKAVFGDKLVKPLTAPFVDNGLVVESVDIQAIEIIDQKTRDALQKSVYNAIKLTTEQTEQEATAVAKRKEQESKAELNRLVLSGMAKEEEQKSKLLELENENNQIVTTGEARAQAAAEGEASKIEGEVAVTIAEIQVKARQVQDAADMQLQKEMHLAKLDYQEKMDTLEIARQKELSSLEASKFGKAMKAIGTDTVAAIAHAGPELQAKLLKGLGLQGYLVTDGTNPINLFNTAQGLTSQTR